MDQVIVNWLLGGLGAMFGFLLHSIWQAVKDLQAADAQLSDKVSRIEILVAGNYVTRSDFDKNMVRVFQKLDAIDGKLDTKVDR